MTDRKSKKRFFNDLGWEHAGGWMKAGDAAHVRALVEASRPWANKIEAQWLKGIVDNFEKKKGDVPTK